MAEHETEAVIVRYQTFIASEFVRRPEKLREFFGGDGRGFWPKGSFRTRFDVVTRFGDDPSLEVERHAAPTRLYREEDGELRFVEQRQVDIDGMQFFENFQEPHRAMWTLQHDVTQGFRMWDRFPYPGIGYEVTVLLQEGASHLLGEHDLAPHHEIWFGVVPGHFWQAYGRENETFVCLGPLPFCEGRINVRL